LIKNLREQGWSAAYDTWAKRVLFYYGYRGVDTRKWIEDLQFRRMMKRSNWHSDLVIYYVLMSKYDREKMNRDISHFRKLG
jgi:hypothetical protein